MRLLVLQTRSHHLTHLLLLRAEMELIQETLRRPRVAISLEGSDVDIAAIGHKAKAKTSQAAECSKGECKAKEVKAAKAAKNATVTEIEVLAAVATGAETEATGVSAETEIFRERSPPKFTLPRIRSIGAVGKTTSLLILLVENAFA